MCITRTGFCKKQDLGVIFLGIRIFEDLKSRKKFFFKIQILGIIEKCIGWVVAYPFLGVFFFIKCAKRMCICEYFNNRIATYKNVFLGLKKCISGLLS